MDYTRAMIREVAGIAAVEVLRVLGVSSGELNYTQASATYGRWFEDAVKDGRLQESRRGVGKNGRRWFSVEDILTLKAYDTARAELQMRQLNQK